MITRLVDAHYAEFESEPNDDRVRFWLRESRNSDVLVSVGGTFPELLRVAIETRPLLVEAMAANIAALKQLLEEERAAEMEADAQYWQPLKKELEQMRLSRREK